MKHFLEAIIVALAIVGLTFASVAGQTSAPKVLMQTEVAADTCIPLLVDHYTYDGLQKIDLSCIRFISYTTERLYVVVQDPGDGIFHNGFEVVP